MIPHLIWRPLLIHHPISGPRNSLCRLQNSRFFSFKGAKRRKRACEARKNDCQLSIQQIRSDSDITEVGKFADSVIIQPMGISRSYSNGKFERIRCMDSRQSYFSASLPSPTLRFYTRSRPFDRRPRVPLRQTNAKKKKLFCSLQPLGKNSLGSFMKSMSEAAGLTGRHTNHSVRRYVLACSFETLIRIANQVERNV